MFPRMSCTEFYYEKKSDSTRKPVGDWLLHGRSPDDLPPEEMQIFLDCGFKQKLIV